RVAGDRRARGPRDPRARQLPAHGRAARLPHRELLCRPRRLRSPGRLPSPAQGTPPMNRFHAHRHVTDLGARVRLYPAPFPAPPAGTPPMNRFHVHLNVTDLGASVRFYTELFAAPPAVLKDDYAKWMLDDPRVNFAISSTGRAPGVDHLGLQVDSSEELAAL